MNQESISTGQPLPESSPKETCFTCGHAKHDGPCVNVHPDRDKPSAEPAPVRGACRRVVWMCKDTGATGHGDAIPADQADAAAKLGNESDRSLMHWTEPAPAPDAGSREIPDLFSGDNRQLRESIAALLKMDRDGVLVPHGISGHAKTLLSAAYNRI